MKIVNIPMWKGTGDNYAYLVIDDKTRDAAIVDPAEPKAVLAVLKKMVDGGEINLKYLVRRISHSPVTLEDVTNYNTHHHGDHTGGNKQILAAYPNLTAYGGFDCKPVTHVIKDGEKLKIGELDVTGLATPCHTQDSICYYVEDKTSGEKAVFTGDTLFIAGCGRFFEGSATEMHKALNATLASLPPTTKIYPGHEYTASNIKFAASILPHNSAVQKLQKYCEENEVTTGKFTLEDDKRWNVFRMVGEKEVGEATGVEGEVEVMKKLREMKNNFK
ncbi:Cytoplasmic glyoxalase II [Saitoella coloradoensis]